MVASIGIGASFCAVLILLILECLKKLKKDERQSIIMFDVLIIGGGVSGISCALVLGSAKIKILQPIKVGVFTHQKSSYRKLF
jgi:heterodisulfide reductase subunit A-like polyferredoxin